MHEKLKRKLPIVIIALLVTAICMIPCYRAGIIDGSDIDFHMSRIYAIYNSIKTGQGINPYIYNTYLSGYGYGLGLFYPAVFLVPFAIIKAVTEISIMLTTKIFIAVCILATCFTSYLAGKNISGKTNTGIAVMILYTMGQYHLVDIYPRADIGEFLAMIFVPLVVWGGYELCERRYKKGILCAAFTGLILSHTISTIICFLFLLVWALIRIKRILNKKCIIGILTEAVICLLITAFYWLPVLEQFFNDEFYVFTKGINSNLVASTLTLDELYAGYSVAFIELGILLLVMFLGLHWKKQSKKAVGFSILTLFLLVIQTKIIPWSLVENTLFKCIQFTCRFNILSEFTLAMAVSCQVSILISETPYQKGNLKLMSNSISKNIILYSAFVLIGCVNLYTVSNMGISVETENSNYAIYTDNDFTNYGDLAGAEWLPDSADLQYIVYSEYSGFVKLENGYISGIYNDDGSYVFDVDDNYTRLAEIPKIYYKGYAAKATLNDGKEMELSISESDNGLVYIDIPENTVSVKVWYEGTYLQEISIVISFVTVIFIILLYFYNKMMRNYVTIKK